MVARCEECLTLNHAIGNKEVDGYTLHNLGVAAWLQQDLPRAETLHASSLALFRELQSSAGVAEVLTSVGRVARAQGNLEQARSAFAESLTLAQQHGPYFVVIEDLEELAGAAVLEHEAGATVRLFSAAQHVRCAKHIRPVPMYQIRHDRSLNNARALLGDAAFEAAYQVGQAMEQEDAIALALEVHTSAVVTQ